MYKDNIVGNLNGVLLEPVSSVYTVSNKYYFDKDIRKELLGREDIS